MDYQKHIFLCFTVLAFVIAPSIAQAERLPEAQCKAFQSEKQKLIRDGILIQMAKGPQWAKQHLKPEELNKIKRYISVTEQVLFRCTGAPEAEQKIVTLKLRGQKRKKPKSARTASLPLPSRKPVVQIAVQKPETTSPGQQVSQTPQTGQAASQEAEQVVTGSVTTTSGLLSAEAKEIPLKEVELNAAPVLQEPVLSQPAQPKAPKRKAPKKEEASEKRPTPNAKVDKHTALEASKKNKNTLEADSETSTQNEPETTSPSSEPSTILPLAGFQFENDYSVILEAK